MKEKSNVTVKVKYLLMGVLIGITMMMSAVVFASGSVTALLSSHVSFFFNGVEKALPDGYEVLTYNGRTYTPARFVAEELGAKVLWDPVTESIFITYDEKTETLPETIDKEEEKDIEKVEKENTDKKNYQKLPITKTAYDATIMLTHVEIGNNETTIYLEVEGRRSYPIQFNRSNATMIVDGVVYDQSNQKRIVDPIDTRWYNDIREDEKVDGWVKFPAIPEDTKYMTVNLEIYRNDGSNEVTEFEFDIVL